MGRIKPTTKLDRAALIHDIEYLKGDQWKADNNMWKNLVRDSWTNIPVANAARAAFLIKDVVGYETPVDNIGYHELRTIVEQDYDLGDMKFYD